MDKKLTRKEFFTTTAKYAAGASVGAAGLKMFSAGQAFAGVADYEWPWPYVKLDVDRVRVLAHESFWHGHCGYAGFNGIIQALAEEVGEPFTLVPPEIMMFSAGGIAGWGTICGAPNGAAAAISLVTDKATSGKLISELLGWYAQAELPTDKSNEFAVNHVFTNNTYDLALPQNVAGSPMCHASVSQWCIESGFDVSSAERKERCGRVAADTAAYAATLLNDNLEGAFSPVFVPFESVAECQSCHGSNSLNNVLSKMDCQTCHSDPHVATKVDRVGGVPAGFALDQNYPNPFNPETKIEFKVPRSEKVYVAVYDISGRLIRTLVDHESYTAGVYSLTWDGRDSIGQRVPSGVYLTKMQAGEFVATKKMTMVK